MENTKEYSEIVKELQLLRKELTETSAKLEEAEDTLQAIRSGEIDALVVKQNDSHQLYTLKTADQTYRIFIEQMKEGVVTLNFHNHILYCNTAFATLAGQPMEKIIGQEFCLYIFGPHWEDCDSLLKKAWENNSKGELNIINSAGVATPVLLSCNRLDLEDTISMSIIVTDLSVQKEYQQILLEKNMQLKEAEKVARYLNTNLEKLVGERTGELENTIKEKTIISEELKANQERLAHILETMAEGVVIMDLDGNITFANPMAQKILALDLQQENGFYHTMAVSETIDGAKLTREEHPMHQSMQTGKPVFDVEIGIAFEGKARTYILVNAAPVMAQNNTIIGSIGTFSDVTRRRISIQQKDDFISVASHELKTPITVLKSSIQLLERMKDNPTHQMLPILIAQAAKGLQKLGYLVEDLLDVSRLKEGQLALNKQRFRLMDMLQDSFAHLHTENKAKVHINADASLELVADANRIEQVLVNFINNAIKYAPGSKTIIIDARKSAHDTIKISVSDEGPGIEAEKQLHLFDRYYRTDYSGAQYSGLGLGLYISSEIIKKHGGTIGVDSVPGKGSSFWFLLPAEIK